MACLGTMPMPARKAFFFLAGMPGPAVHMVMYWSLASFSASSGVSVLPAFHDASMVATAAQQVRVSAACWAMGTAGRTTARLGRTCSRTRTIS